MNCYCHFLSFIFRCKNKPLPRTLCSQESVFEGAAAEEFAEEGGGGDEVGGDGAEVAEEFAEAVGFGVLGDVGGYGAEDLFGGVAEYAELEDEG